MRVAWRWRVKGFAAIKETLRAWIVRFRLLLSGLSLVAVKLPCLHGVGRMPYPNAINANLRRTLDTAKVREQMATGREKEE